MNREPAGEWRYEAKARFEKLQYDEVLLAPGAEYIEGVVRIPTQIKHAIWEAGRSLGLTRREINSFSINPNQRKLAHALEAAGYPVSEVNYVPTGLQPAATIEEYTRIFHRTADESTRKHNRFACLANSVGTLAAEQAVYERILQGKSLPELLVLIDPGHWNLSFIARRYLHFLGQSEPSRAIPALLELLGEHSAYTSGLRHHLRSIQDKLPLTVIVNSRVSNTKPGWVACPFAAIPEEKFRKITKHMPAFPYESGDDGMFREGDNLTIWPHGKLVQIDLVGLTHNDTLTHAMPLITEIITRQTIRGMRIEQMTTWPPKLWPTINFSHRLQKPDNRVMGVGMELLFRMIAASDTI